MILFIFYPARPAAIQERLNKSSQIATAQCFDGWSYKTAIFYKGHLIRDISQIFWEKRLLAA